MGPREIELLLGLFFSINSLSFANGRISADFIRLIAGLILVVMAVLNITLYK